MLLKLILMNNYHLLEQISFPSCTETFRLYLSQQYRGIWLHENKKGLKGTITQI